VVAVGDPQLDFYSSHFLYFGLEGEGRGPCRHDPSQQHQGCCCLADYLVAVLLVRSAVDHFVVQAATAGPLKPGAAGDQRCLVAQEAAAGGTSVQGSAVVAP